MRSKAIIVDLDGCLFDSAHRMHFITGAKGIKSYSAWIHETDRDIPNQWCQDLIMGFRLQGYKIIYVTGRNEDCRETTRSSLLRHVPGSQHEELLMRGAKDNRPDNIVKQEIYFQEIIQKYQVVLAVDDRPGVAKMWRHLGITCLHCAGWEEDPAIFKQMHETFKQEIEKQ